MLALESADFRFLDPPEPGARARVAIRVANTADAPSDRIVLGIASDWFARYSIIGSVPGVFEDRTDDDGLRTFSFPPLPAGETASYELHVAPTRRGDPTADGCRRCWPMASKSARSKRSPRPHRRGPGQ